MTDSDLRDKYGDLTGEQVAALDRAATGHGVSVTQLMEIAGWQVARWIHAGQDGGLRPILVVVGHGNNGGDALVAARHLLTWGHAVRAVVVAERERLGEVVVGQLAAAEAAGLAVTFAADGDLDQSLTGAALVVDGLLGTGVRGDPRPPQARAITGLPADRTVAIDVPSGLDATSGTPGTPTVQATATCTLTAMKAGLWNAGARAHAGVITVADIGMPIGAWLACGLRPPSLVRGGELLLVPTDTR